VRFSVPGEPVLQAVPSLLSLGQQQVTKMTGCSGSLARAGHEGMALFPCPPLWGHAGENCQRQDPRWGLLLPWVCPAEVMIALPIIYGSILSPVLGWTPKKSCRNNSGLRHWTRQWSGQKNLHQIVQALFSGHSEAHSIRKLYLVHLVCVCVHVRV